MSRELKEKIKLIAKYTESIEFPMSNAEIIYVTSVLELDGKNGSELNNLRDEIILYYQKQVETIKRESLHISYKTFITQICAISHCIDLALIKLGALELRNENSIVYN